MQAHDYRTAEARLTDLLASFEGERALSDRARVYLSLCQRELAKAPVAPTTIEDRLIAATAALNRGADLEAERLARDVALDDDRQDLAFYILAAVDARRGTVQSALANLTRAIQIRPDLAAQALHDEDFTRLRDLEAFRDLTGPAAPGGRRSHEPPTGR
jgi:hypothetical protein